MNNKIKKNVFVAGHMGMVGSAILRKLKSLDKYNILTRTRQDLNLLSQSDVLSFFSNHKIDQV